MPPPSRKSLTTGRWRAVALSILVHAAIVAAAVYGWFTWKHEPPVEMLAVQGTLVDERELKGVPPIPGPQKEPEPTPEPVPEPEPEPEPPPPEEQGPPAPDPAEIERRQEEERLAAEKLEQEKQQQLDREKQEQQRLEDEKKQAEKKEADRRSREAGRGRRGGEEGGCRERLLPTRRRPRRSAPTRPRPQGKPPRKRRDWRRRRNSGAVWRPKSGAMPRATAQRPTSWHASIVAKITRAWNQTAIGRGRCDLYRDGQSGAGGGEVTSVSVDSCNPNDAALRQSVENGGVSRLTTASLRPPGVPFERNLELTFAPRK